MEYRVPENAVPSPETTDSQFTVSSKRFCNRYVNFADNPIKINMKKLQLSHITASIVPKTVKSLLSLIKISVFVYEYVNFAVIADKNRVKRHVETSCELSKYMLSMSKNNYVQIQGLGTV